jgi:hypothetical protein
LPCGIFFCFFGNIYIRVTIISIFFPTIIERFWSLNDSQARM